MKLVRSKGNERITHLAEVVGRSSRHIGNLNMLSKILEGFYHTHKITIPAYQNGGVVGLVESQLQHVHSEVDINALLGIGLEGPAKNLQDTISALSAKIFD